MLVRRIRVVGVSVSGVLESEIEREREREREREIER